MHLTPYPLLVQGRSHRSTQQGALWRTSNSNHSSITGGRLSSSVISASKLHRNNDTNSSSRMSNRMMTSLKMSSSSTSPQYDLAQGGENETLRLHSTVVDVPLDLWAVIKPGHVREKIAIFTSDGSRAGAVAGSERTISISSSGKGGIALATHTNLTSTSGVSRGVKAKGGWEENSNAKRRRRSGNNQNQRIRPDARIHTPTHCALDGPLQPGDANRKQWARVGEAVDMEEELKVSVVEMVTFLEQRASEQQCDFKRLLSLQRSSTTITLSRAPPIEDRQRSEEEEPESVRVSDMVAKLESECLKRRSEGGDLSRTNSLRRTVGRVLLAEPSSISSLPTSSSVQSEVETASRSESSLLAEPCSVITAPPQSPTLATSPFFPGTLEVDETRPHCRDVEAQNSQSQADLKQTATAPLIPPSSHTPPQPEKEEPPPGLLFLSPPAAASDAVPHSCKASSSSLLTQGTSTHHLPPPRTQFDLCLPSDPVTVYSQTLPHPASDSCRSEIPTEKPSYPKEEQGGHGGRGSATAPVARHPSASQDFLQMRQRLQQLLEPQLYLSVLPHHLLLKIFLLLPTHSLAALKCTCHYFKFIIENYGVRPADSLWVSDPRYRDDPCKQCKKRYGFGDVSLCRWHHKPFCQALPYGPGYWMCCHTTQRDAPGCNVGLHDNCWVPAFHSFNMPICRRSVDD